MKNCKNKETITLLLKNEIAEYKSEITILYEKPKIKSLKEIFSNLFKVKEKEQTIEEQIALLRSMK